MTTPSPSARALRLGLAAALTCVVLALAHWDRLYMFGDDVNKLSPGRALPLPERGNYIASRIVDNYFIGYGFEVFRAVVGPLFGLAHLVDVHSVYSTVVYAVSAVAVLLALFELVRLVIPLRARHFLVFAPAAHVLALAPTKMMAITGIGSFQVPLALSLWLLYPVVRYAVLGTDALATWRPAGAAAAMAGLAYLVAFSVTSVAVFTLGVVVSCTGCAFVRAHGNPLGRVTTWPRWFRLTAGLLPALVALATAYDFTSGRYAHERQQEFRVVGFEELSWVQGLTHLPVRHPGALGAVAALALAAAAFATARAWLRSPAAVRNLVLGVLAAFGPTFLAYTFFLLRISNLGGKDYFAHPGISAYFPFASCVVVLAALFGLARSSSTAAAVAGAAGLALFAVHGGRQLAEVPTRDVTKAEVMGIFDAMYTCHAYGESRVPVLLRNVPLGWPYGAAEEGWYMDAYRLAFREHVVGYGGYVDPSWTPVFYQVRSVTELRGALQLVVKDRPLLDPGFVRSPYAIDPFAPFGAGDHLFGLDVPR